MPSVLRYRDYALEQELDKNIESMKAHTSRPRTTQVMALLMTIAGITAICYMYRIINDLHREQQEMRSQLTKFLSHQPSHQPPAPSQFDQDAAPRMTASSDVSRPGIITVFDSPANEDPRRLGQMMTVGTSSGVGCYSITTGGTNTFDVSSATACNGNTCPDCFFIGSGVTAAVTLTISSCSSAQWARSQTRSGAWSYTIINANPTYTVSVTDNGGGITYKVPASSHMQAYCSSSLGTTNRLYWPSTTLPTLSVDSGFTLSAGNFDASSSSGTFATSTGTNTVNGNLVISGSNTFTSGTGAVTLNGATSVSGTNTLTVGAAGSAGATTLYGNLIVGATSASTSSVTVNGDFTQQDTTATSAFTTGSSTVTLNGNVAVASGKNIAMSGSGTFTSGTGAVTLSGDTSISGSKTFSSGTGAVSLNGATTIASSKAFTVGTSGSGGTTTLYGNVVIGAVANGVTLTVNGNFAQADSTSSSTFSTGTGAISLNGDVSIAQNKNLAMSSTGTGTFTTGTGTVTLSGNVLISGSNTFTTGTGAVSILGSTTIADSKPFTVGSSGAGGQVNLYGAVLIGANDNSASTSLTVYGNVAFNDDASGTAKTFSTGSGTISLNGDVAVAFNKNLAMSSAGSGTFTTGTGSISLNGDTTVKSGKSFYLATSSSTMAINCVSANSAAGSSYCLADR